MTTLYLKSPTWLYHKQLAPEGKLFVGSADKPLPHPGEGWNDSPASENESAPVTAETVVAANAGRDEAQASNEALTNRLSDANRAVEAAEGVIRGHKAALDAEKADHAKTRALLETADAELAAARRELGTLAAVKAEADKVPGLTEQLQQAQAAASELSERLDAATAKPQKKAA